MRRVAEGDSFVRFPAEKAKDRGTPAHSLFVMQDGSRGIHEKFL
jgi:hypothetical protein